MKKFFHVFANGDDARNFIVCLSDFQFQFNLVATCAFNSGVIVCAFSIEESHPHFLLYGIVEDVLRFIDLYQTCTIRHIVSTRGSGDNVQFELAYEGIEDEEYLMNVAPYVIIQPTKDGKKVMPYDYMWGTGSLYFRPDGSVPIWLYDKNGDRLTPVCFGSFNSHEKDMICGSRLMRVPDDWLVCNGLILPQNYVDINMFERIFGTHNRFRVFCSGSSKKTDIVKTHMAETRGLMLEDLEARAIARECSKELFGRSTIRNLAVPDRLKLALELRRRYSISFRQLATVCRLPEYEVRKYVH